MLIYFVSIPSASSQTPQGYAPLPSDMEEYRRKLAAWNEDLSKNPLLLKAKRKYKRAHKKLRLIPLNANAQYVSNSLTCSTTLIFPCVDVQIHKRAVPSS